MILQHHIPDWVVTVVALLLVAAAIIATEKKKPKKVAYIIEVAVGIWYFLNGWWVLALVWFGLICVMLLVDYLKAKHDAKHKAAKRREDESVANSAGTPDNLPY